MDIFYLYGTVMDFPDPRFFPTFSRILAFPLTFADRSTSWTFCFQFLLTCRNPDTVIQPTSSFKAMKLIDDVYN